MLEWCHEARAIGREHAMAVVERMLFPAWSGAAMIERGEYREGHERLASGVGAWQASGGVHQTPRWKVMLARSFLATGQPDQAELLVRDAIELIDRTGHCMDQAEAHRVLGEVLVARGDSKSAATAFVEALEIAQAQQAKSWELRGAISYARFLNDQNQRPKALAILRPVYGWFTEGFDTRDLRRAKALLDELR
jgi:predicted ATPase